MSLDMFPKCIKCGDACDEYTTGFVNEPIIHGVRMDIKIKYADDKKVLCDKCLRQLLFAAFKRFYHTASF